MLEVERCAGVERGHAARPRYCADLWKDARARDVSNRSTRMGGRQHSGAAAVMDSPASDPTRCNARGGLPATNGI